MIRKTLQFGSKTIEFELDYFQRKTLGITVTPDLDVIVKAPENSKYERIEEKIRKKAPWILKQLDHFLAFHPKTPPKKYINGETHLYMGRQYQLSIVNGKKDSVRYKGRFIEVTTNDKPKVKKILTHWYRMHAERKFAEIAKPLIERFRKYKVEPNGVNLYEMPKRWGSCTPNGKIILNPELIKAHKSCIEYVIVHELCHLVHHNHTKKFFELQTKEMPDWKKWKLKLEKSLI